MQRTTSVKQWITNLLVLAMVVLCAYLLAVNVSSSAKSDVARTRTIAESSLLQLVNEARLEHGKEPLTGNLVLNATAQEKVDDFIARDYWKHETPEGDRPGDTIFRAFPSADKSGENLARCQTSEAKVVEQWTESPEHFEILIGDFEFFGEGKTFNDKDSCWYTVAHFVK